MRVGGQLRINIERESRNSRTVRLAGDLGACSRKKSDTCKLTAREDIVGEGEGSLRKRPRRPVLEGTGEQKVIEKTKYWRERVAT